MVKGLDLGVTSQLVSSLDWAIDSDREDSTSGVGNQTRVLIPEVGPVRELLGVRDEIVVATTHLTSE